MIDFTPAQAAPRIENLLAARESRPFDFKRVGADISRALIAFIALGEVQAQHGA